MLARLFILLLFISCLLGCIQAQHTDQFFAIFSKTSNILPSLCDFGECVWQTEAQKRTALIRYPLPGSPCLSDSLALTTDDQRVAFHSLIDSKGLSLVATTELEFAAQLERLSNNNDDDRLFAQVNSTWPTIPDNPNPTITSLLESVSIDHLEAFLDELTSIHTRLTATEGCADAAVFLQKRLESLGYTPQILPFRCTTCWASDSTPVVVYVDILGSDNAKLPASEVAWIVVGGHYDDRASSILDTTARAPGCNDDGGGTAAVVEIARVLSSSINRQQQFQSTANLRLALFAGEEQGLYGSAALAAQMKSEQKNVIGMLQLDMISYLVPSEQPGLAMAVRSVSLPLVNYCNNVTRLYVPQLTITDTTSCCTDSQSFYNQGYPAVAYNEPGGYTIDPEYHRTDDTCHRPGYSFEQLRLIAQAALAAAATLAQIV